MKYILNCLLLFRTIFCTFYVTRVVELSSATIVERLHQKNKLSMVLRLLLAGFQTCGILAIICLELTAIMIIIAIDIAAPTNTPLISIKVNAAKTVAFSIYSKLTIVIYPYLWTFSSNSLCSSSF